MSYADRLKLDVARYTPEDRAAMVEFEEEMFGPQARQLDEDHFRWLFEQIPCRPDGGPQIWLCKKDAKVVGQQCGMPLRLKVGKGDFQASWAIDLMVRPRWRMRGVGPALSSTYIESNEVTLGLGISDQAYRSFLRSGWTDLGTLPLYVRPLNIPRMLDGMCPDKRLLRWAARGVWPLLRLVDVARGLCRRPGGFTLQPIERFDQRADELWQEAREEHPVLAHRDYRSLSWRFDLSPVKEEYQRFYLLSNDRVRGYLVTRAGTRHGVPVGFVVDYLCPTDCQAALFAHGITHLRKQGAAAVYCSTVNRAGVSVLRSLGFRRRGSGSRFMAKVTAADPSISDAVGRSENWFVTSADSDVEYGHGK